MSEHLDLANTREKKLSVDSSAYLVLQAQQLLPTPVMQALIEWTGGEPSLTQALCQLVFQFYGKEESSKIAAILDEQAVDWLENLIRFEVIIAWETSPELEPLRKIGDRLLNNRNCEPFWLLNVYKQILQEQELLYDRSPEQQELLAIGLVVKQQENLIVHNRIYQLVFNSDWIDKQLTSLSPYQLTLQKLEAKANSPYTVLEEILSWTNRNFFLTQKVCHLVCVFPDFIPAGKEAETVAQIVEKYLVEDWENQVAATHLKNIRDRLLKKDRAIPKLLKVYQQVLVYPEVPATYNSEQQELLKLGLLDVDRGSLIVYNRIYQRIFNLNWVEIQLAKINQTANHKSGVRSSLLTQQNNCIPQKESIPPIDVFGSLDNFDPSSSGDDFFSVNNFNNQRSSSKFTLPIVISILVLAIGFTLYESINIIMENTRHPLPTIQKKSKSQSQAKFQEKDGSGKGLGTR